MESFYGGKQGASFVIKDTFAWTTEAAAIKVLGDKDAFNSAKKNYEIMETAFKDPAYQGVWYGEYCLIDTKNKNHPENGQIYRRTYKKISQDNSGWGDVAEYVGQIVGPASGTPSIHLGSLEDADTGAKTFKPGATNPDGSPLYNSASFYAEGKEELQVNQNLGTGTLKRFRNAPGSGVFVPGFIAGETEKENVYNDEFIYSWANVRTPSVDPEKECVTDESRCYIGFQMPYLVQNWDAERIGFNGQISLVDKDTEHSFYQDWLLSIPAGLPGVGIQAIEEIIFTLDAEQGIILPDNRIFYNTSDLKQQDDGSYILNKKNLYTPPSNLAKEKSFIAIKLAYPVADGETYKLENNWFGIDSFNQICDINVSTETSTLGKITVDYQGDKETQTFGLQLPNNFTLVGDATSENANKSRQITIGFSNNGKSIQIGNDINYIQGVKYTDDYHLLILFNSPNYRKPAEEDLIYIYGQEENSGSFAIYTPEGEQKPGPTETPLLDNVKWRRYGTDGLYWKDLGVVRQVDQGLACGAEILDSNGESFTSKEAAVAALNDKENKPFTPKIELNEQKMVVCSIQESGKKAERHLFAYGLSGTGEEKSKWFWVGSFASNNNNNNGIVITDNIDGTTPIKGLVWLESSTYPTLTNNSIFEQKWK